MAQDPLKPKVSPKIEMPKIAPGMNKVAPVSRPGGKGRSDDATVAAESMSKKDVEKLLARIRKRMDRCIQAESDNRRAALDDLRFKAGDQWPADVAAQRTNDKRPCLTINRLPTLIHQVTNSQRENRPSINVNPIGDRGDPEVALMFRGLIREIERESNADEAYDTAFDNAVSNGFGYWRVLTEFESPDSFNKVIRIKRIRNPFTVYMDPDSQDSVGSDSKYCFVTEMIPKDEFKELYPKAQNISFDQGGVGEKFKNWADADNVRVAEYFEIKNKSRTLVALSNGHIGWKDELVKEVKNKIASGEFTILRERESQVPKIKWYKVNALEVLEEKEWIGDWIPVIKVIGDEIDIEGKVKLFGMIRNAKDSQRMLNYWRTLETELIALAPKAPWVVEEGQIEGHEQEWKQANIKSYPYLSYKATSVNGVMAPPPQRQQFAQIPAGAINAAQNAAQDLMSTTGVRFDSTPGERMIDESGKAITELRRTGDIGAFHFVDNLSRALMHTGAILIDLIPKIYDTKRVVTILREDDSEEHVTIDPNASKPVTEQRMPVAPAQPGQQPDAAKVQKIFNPTFGKYGVTVSTGPSYATKRIEAATQMLDFSKAVPQAGPLIMDLIAKNLDWEGADEIAKRLAKAIPPNLMTPDQKDISPQVQAMLQSMDGQIKQLTAERMQMMKALNDKQADRDIEVSKINHDFEAKMLAVVQKMEQASLSSQTQVQTTFMTHIGAEIKALGDNVGKLMKGIDSNQTTSKDTGEPPVPGARQAGDGQWYLNDPNRPGKYMRVVPRG